MTNQDRNMRTLITCFVIALVALVPLRIIEVQNLAVPQDTMVLGEETEVYNDEYIEDEIVEEEIDEEMLLGEDTEVFEEELIEEEVIEEEEIELPNAELE